MTEPTAWKPEPLSHTSRAECDIDGWRWYCGICGTWADTPTWEYAPTRDAGQDHIAGHRGGTTV